MFYFLCHFFRPPLRKKEFRICETPETRLSDDDDFKRDELIRKIEHSVEQMTLSELEALSYDMFTKGYMEDY